MLTSWMASRSSMGSGSPVLLWKRLVSRSKESARLCAGSTLITSVRCPRRESCRPVAAARLVFPTPPLPLKRRMRMLQSYDAAVRPKVRQHPSDIRFVFEWRDEYSVGVGSIDAQHRTLFGLAAELWEAIAAGRGKSACNKTLDRLVLYTATHFAHEQRLMELYHYSGFAEHKAEHDALTQQVLKFQ